MTESEFIGMYGQVIYDDFRKFMRGQTVRITEEGETYYYKHDIDNYFANDGDRFFD